MVRQIDKSLRQTKPSPRAARALPAVMMTALRPALGIASAAVLLIGSASADDKYKLLGWNWSFQKKPMAAAFVFCNTNAPKDPSAPPEKKGSAMGQGAGSDPA